MRNNIAFDKSLDFAVQIVELSDYLQQTYHDYVLSRQILKSGTSIGANLRESRNAQSVDDFISKLSISLKEADETQFWLDLLHLSHKINEDVYTKLYTQLNDIISILVSSIRTAKANQQNTKKGY